MAQHFVEPVDRFGYGDSEGVSRSIVMVEEHFFIHRKGLVFSIRRRIGSVNWHGRAL